MMSPIVSPTVRIERATRRPTTPTEHRGGTEHSNRAYYRRDILGKLHKDRLIEGDRDTEMAIISPTGIANVEEDVLPALEAKDPPNKAQHRTPSAPVSFNVGQ